MRLLNRLIPNKPITLPMPVDINEKLPSVAIKLIQGHDRALSALDIESIILDGENVTARCTGLVITINPNELVTAEIKLIDSDLVSMRILEPNTITVKAVVESL